MTPSEKDHALIRLCRFVELRGLRPNTIASYRWCARQFVNAVDKPLSDVTREDVEDYVLALRDAGKSASTCNVTLAAIRMLLRANTDTDATVAVPRAKCPKRLVSVLSGSEVERIFASTHSAKYRAIFMLAYGAGLRISEICNLQIDDIDSRRGLIRVRQSKTGERYVPLGSRLLEVLRSYYKTYRPPGPALFPGRRPGSVLTRNAINKVLRKVVKRAGVNKHATPHTFRHSCATHLLDTGTDIRTVQVLLGHAHIESTTTYLHVSRAHIARVPSPLDLIGTTRGRALG